MLSDLLFRLRALARRGAVERDLDDELTFHVEQQRRAYIAAGMDPVEAARRARMAFGGVDQVKERCRDSRGVSTIDSAIQDLRYAVRGMRRSRPFTLTAVLTLALTTGAIATVLTLADTLLFRPPAIDRPEELVVVSATRRHGRLLAPVSYRDYVRFRDGARTLSGLAAHYSTAPLWVIANGRSREINGAVVSANFFPLLAVTPSLGRFFHEDEDRVPDRDRVVVLSDAMWRDWFAASPAVLGQAVKVNGVDFTVIGVAPKGFLGVSPYPSQLYLPTMMLGVGYRWCENPLTTDCTVLDTIGRLAAGHTIEQARAEMSTFVAQWASAPDGDNTAVTVFRPRGVEHESADPRLITLLTLVVTVLLLVCCANLAGLLTVRGRSRARELAIRVALGASRSRLARQLMTESLLLAVAGSVLGGLLSFGLIGLLASTFYSVNNEGTPVFFAFELRANVILALVLVTAVAAFLFGLIPALASIRAGAALGLKKQPSTASARSRAGLWMVGGQAAAAVALVAVASLLLVGARAAADGSRFESSHVALLRLRPRLLQYPPEQAQRFQRAVAAAFDTVPGVESFSFVGSGIVLSGARADVSLPGGPDAERHAMRVAYIDVGPRYFETLHIPLLRGREFDARDTVDAPPVAVVNETLARHLWPTGAAIGSTVNVNQHPHLVVGIARDASLQSRADEATPYVYVPYWQNADAVDARYCVRVKGDPGAMIATLVEAVNRVDPNVPVTETITLPFQIAEGQLKPARLSAAFMGYAAFLAVLLSGLGLFGTLAFAVTRRTREIGIRLALGARAADVLRMVVREGMIVVFAGSAVGLGLAMWSTRYVRHLLYGSPDVDVVLYTAACVLVVAVGLVACWIPARRASRVQPVMALHEE